MPKRSGSSIDIGDKSASVGQLRSTYEVRLTDEFKDSLRRVDKTQSAKIVAQFQARFMRDWLAGVSEAELNRAHDYKALQGSAAKTWKVMQIRVLRDYRIALTIISETSPPEVVLLHVYLRHGKRKNDADYAQAIATARRIREGLK